jgi:hypothetical protein
MNEKTHFNETFNKYLGIKDKFDSLYIFVINKLNLEDITDKISRIITFVDSMSDVKKKSYLKSKLCNFREYLKNNYKPETLISNIFFVNNEVYSENLTPYYKQTLELFAQSKLLYEYACEYPLEWLKNLLLDREYINVIKIKNNDITHSKINSSKRINVYSSTIKSMELDKIISERIPNGEPYIIHGVSSVLKNFTDKNAIAVHTTELTDEYILKIVSNIKMSELHKELDNILSKLLDPKFGNKIIFGKDIQICVKNSLLKTLYCSNDIYKKISNIPEHLRNFEIKVINQIFKGDIFDRLDKDFAGAVGIKYY